MELQGERVVAVAGAAWQGPAIREFDLFVIHADDDADFVRGYLIPALNLPPSRVLLVDDLTPGALAVAEIERGVARSRFTVAVLSPAYLADRWAVFGELLASHVSVDDLGVDDVHVIPLRLGACKLPLRLEARVALDFTDRAAWDSEAARLRKLLQTAAPGAEQIRCPYPGMRSFAQHEAGQFFGRDQEIDDLIGRLDRGERAIYVIGPSGSGKSSLVQAGLLPALGAGTSRLERSFVVRTMRPGERPTDRLVKALKGDLATPAATIEAFVARHPPADRVLVFVDQLEELFTLAGPDERQRFVAALRALGADPRCYLLLAVRADFCGALVDSALCRDLAEVSRLDVAALRGPALLEAIIAPAARVGVHLEARLGSRLAADAGDQPGALPHVQETLRLLWEARRQRLLGLAEYEALGDGGSGLHVAISARADTTLRALTAAQRTIARRVLLRLVSFGEGRPDTRRQQEIRALRSAADDESEFPRVLQRLVADRLVTVDGAERADHALADLSHEALITAWPTFRAWIARRRADEQRRRRLEAKVGEWIERGRGAASLLDLVGIAEAVQWMQSYAARELGYGTELRALVAASRRQLEGVERQRRRRTFFTIAVLVVFSVVVSITGLVVSRQRSAAQHNLGMVYQEQGRAALLDGHPMQAVLYFVAARAEGIEGPVLRTLFALASSSVPSVTFMGHGAPVMSAVFSPDGTRVATASQDGTARVWNAAAGTPVTPKLPHRSGVLVVAFSPDGTHVITASADGTARIWDAATGQPVTPPLEHQGPVNAAAFSPDGTRVVTASDDHTAQIWDAKGTPVTLPLEHQGAVRAAAFSPDGTRVVTASDDTTARIWDATTGQAVTPPLPHKGAVLAAAFSPDGTRVVTASQDEEARIWDASTGQPVSLPLRHQGRVNVVAFSPDGTRVVTASDDKTARVWDAWTGAAVTPPLEHQGIVGTAAFSPDATRVVTASFDKTVRVWDAATGEPAGPPLEHQGYVYAAAFDLDGTRVVTASFDKKARIWDTSRRTAATPPLLHDDFVHAAAFSPDGTRVVTASFDKTARVWDAVSGKPVTPPLAHQGYVYAAAFSPDGTRVVTASFDKTARVWDAASGKPVTPPLAHQGYVYAAAFSPDGTRVVTASDDKTARVWSVSTGELATLPFVHQGAVYAAAFSPDGTRVITGSGDQTAQIWYVAMGTPLGRPLRHRGQVNAVAFSPDGTRVVTASADDTAQIWDVTAGTLVTPPLEHQGQVNAVAFSPDGTRVVTASADTTARVWDAATGLPLTPPLEHQGDVHAAAFSGGGHRVVTASDDGTARIWDASTGKPISPPLVHRGVVHAAAFSRDGLRVVTASDDNKARVWSLPLDRRSLEVWRALGRCSSFALANGVLTTNAAPLQVCPRR